MKVSGGAHPDSGRGRPFALAPGGSQRNAERPECDIQPLAEHRTRGRPRDGCDAAYRMRTVAAVPASSVAFRGMAPWFASM